jgi:hypothetical protein
LRAAGATIVLAPFSCATGPHGRSNAVVHVDASFARAVIQSHVGLEQKLLDHPALAAMVRHQRMSGRQDATPASVLASVLDAVRRAPPTSHVLDAWREHHAELADDVAAAAAYLPAGSRFTGTVYLVVGYDIGVASPPDILLNVAHEHFQDAPSELGFYAAHEAHHVGFLAVRPFPALTHLDDPVQLRSIVAYMTQLEGMGVHAAYPLRRDRGGLRSDRDYRVYTDSSEARRVTARYAEILAMLAQPGNISDKDIAIILGAMSSGERLWYQLGALACATLERTRGRGALIDSIASPREFDRVVAELLAVL